jgi:type IV pilus assembly protein PilC
MAHFIFKARKSGGQVYKGERDAKDRYEIYRILKQSGEEVLSVDERRGFSFSKISSLTLPFLNGIKAHEKITFTRNLGSMIKAGLSMSRALTVMQKQGKSPQVKKIIATLIEEISKGKTLSEAMGLFKNMFSPLVISMVHSGEQSGTLAEALKVVSTQMDKNYTLQKRIRGALMYPGIILCAMIVIAIILLTYIVPTLMKTFSELNLALPASTRFILGISSLIQNHGIVLLLAIIIVGGLLYIWSRQENGKKVIHYAVLKIPVIGNLIKEVNAARTARSLSSLVNSGVDVLESIKITTDIVQNVHYKRVLQDAAVSVEKGEPISKIFTQNDKLYPLFLGEMISVGEETGKIGEMLLGVAVYYEEDVDQKTKDMSTIIEPVLMVFIAAAVGFFAVAMISPMYSLVNSL